MPETGIKEIRVTEFVCRMGLEPGQRPGFSRALFGHTHMHDASSICVIVDFEFR